MMGEVFAGPEKKMIVSLLVFNHLCHNFNMQMRNPHAHHAANPVFLQLSWGKMPIRNEMTKLILNYL
jgi:hypothetical protein